MSEVRGQGCPGRSVEKKGKHKRFIDVVARAAAQRVGTRTVRGGPDGDLIVWQRPNKAHGMKGEQYRTYPKSIL
ncbi:MAG TPA: hypothetical protein VMS17_01040, partial [Gemmataceae bacterium]|nr:hypothetical protein [Gemmataceae bacterium]